MCQHDDVPNLRVNLLAHRASNQGRITPSGPPCCPVWLGAISATLYIYTVYIVYHSIIYIYISISILSISLSISISIYTYHIYLLYGGWSKGPCKESCLRRSFIWCFETSPKFFFEFAKVTFYLAKASRKLGIIIVYMHNL